MSQWHTSEDSLPMGLCVCILPKRGAFWMRGTKQQETTRRSKHKSWKRLGWSGIGYQLGFCMILATSEGVGCNCSLHILLPQVALLVSCPLDVTVKNYRPWVQDLSDSGKNGQWEVCCNLQAAFAEAGRQQLNRTTCLPYQALKNASSGLPALSWQIFYTRNGKSTSSLWGFYWHLL